MLYRLPESERVCSGICNELNNSFKSDLFVVELISKLWYLFKVGFIS